MDDFEYLDFAPYPNDGAQPQSQIFDWWDGETVTLQGMDSPEELLDESTQAALEDAQLLCPTFNYNSQPDLEFEFINHSETAYVQSERTTSHDPITLQSSQSSVTEYSQFLDPQSVLQFEFEETGHRDRQWAIQCIEQIFSRLAVVLSVEQEYKSLEVRMKIRSSKAQRFDPLTKSIRNSTQYTSRMLRFPGKTDAETWKFAVVLRILALILDALNEDQITTKRDIYYKDVALFRSQSVVNTVVDDIAYTFGVDRSKLNIVAAAKGLVSGPLKIWYKGGGFVECWKDPEGMLIPNIRAIESLDIQGAKWILIIEKEATFRSLATMSFWSTCTTGEGILITAKGYPDISTREFLRLLSLGPASNSTICSDPDDTRSLPICSIGSSQTVYDDGRPSGRIPMFALMDYDPHGFDILAVYKFGSFSLAHENHRLVVGDLRYLGVRSRDLDLFQSLNRDRSSIREVDDGLLKLTARDRKKAVRMLNRAYIWEQKEWREELQRMLFMNVKAEIQVMYTGYCREIGGIKAYVESKLEEAVAQGIFVL